MSKETWVEEFEKEFRLLDRGYCSGPDYKAVKSFISKVRDEAVLEERRRLVSEIDKEKETLFENGNHKTSYYRIKMDILEALKRLINKDK